MKHDQVGEPITVIENGTPVQLLRFTDENGVKYSRNILERQAQNVDDWETLFVKNTVKGENGEKGQKALKVKRERRV